MVVKVRVRGDRPARRQGRVRQPGRTGWRRPAAVAILAGFLATGCFLEEAKRVQQESPESRPWFCTATGEGGRHGDGHNHSDPAYEGTTKGDLSWDDCLSVAEAFDGAWGYASQYPTRSSAEAAGWVEQVAYAPGMGTHHMNMANSGPFNPTRPVFLQYGGAGPDAPLVGLTWWVSNGSQPPAGFAGANDWFHSHGAICFVGTQAIAQDNALTREECEFFGGYLSSFPGYWMLHAWIVPGWENKVDVFAGAHPCLLNEGIAPEGHVCWAQAAGTAPPDEHGGGHHGH